MLFGETHWEHSEQPFLSKPDPDPKKNMRSNGLRYLRWGGDGEAVQPEKC